MSDSGIMSLVDAIDSGEFKPHLLPRSWAEVIETAETIREAMTPPTGTGLSWNGHSLALAFRCLGLWCAATPEAVALRLWSQNRERYPEDIDHSVMAINPKSDEPWLGDVQVVYAASDARRILLATALSYLHADRQA